MPPLMARPRGEAEDVPRQELQKDLFVALDVDGDGHLSSVELRFFAHLAGFVGSASDWAQEFQALCSERQSDPRKGLDFTAFMALTDDLGPHGCFCSPAELREFLAHTIQPSASNEATTQAPDSSEGDISVASSPSAPPTEDDESCSDVEIPAVPQKTAVSNDLRQRERSRSPRHTNASRNSEDALVAAEEQLPVLQKRLADEQQEDVRTKIMADFLLDLHRSGSHTSGNKKSKAESSAATPPRKGQTRRGACGGA